MIYWGPAPLVPFRGYFQSRLALRPRHTALIQPPVLARAVLQVFRVDEDKAFLSEMLPRLDRYYGWLAEQRDPDGDGLITIISPYESGMDHRPAYDHLLGVRSSHPSRLELEFKLRWLDTEHLLLPLSYNLRRIMARGRFVVEDVLVNCIYADGLRSLAELHRAASDALEAELWDARAQRVEAAILEKCYDPATGLYFDLYGRAERKQGVLTVTALFPLILPSLPRARAEELVRH
ncbi:MAG: hypothetical protein HYY31_00060, partial [Chloroflexi bacterium]|nr:hypothetical protein [Chloroflexota bacterium]